MTVSAASTGNEKFAEAVLYSESVTVTWKLTGPAEGGVPLR